MIIGTLTVVGQQVIRNYLADYAAHSLYVAWGMCSTANTALDTDTSLVNELDRVVATTSVSGDELTISSTKVNINPREILEVGIFDEAAGGNMIYRGLFSDDSSTAKSRWLNGGDTLNVSIVFDFASGAFV